MGYIDIHCFIAAFASDYGGKTNIIIITTIKIFSNFDTIFLYFYNCRHMFRSIGTHKYSIKLPKKKSLHNHIFFSSAAHDDAVYFNTRRPCSPAPCIAGGDAETLWGNTRALMQPWLPKHQKGSIGWSRSS